ncbi:hypothetical protein SCB49_02459 [unidentified eubacterium SCB49]|nr:hypothetical protein SCB49_02459 [unidentified eubacterium SCB49]
MTEKLLEDAFQKARKEGASNTALGLATHIYNELENKCSLPTTADSIRGYYRKLEKNESFNISKTAKDHLSIYLGFEDYKSYLDKRNTKSVSAKWYQWALLALIIIVAFFVYNTTRKKCMIWDKDHFVKIHCEEVDAKPIDQSLFANFKKIEANCTEGFFINEDGSVNVWYYKRGENDLELFTSPGVHPVNGKTLNEITKYMIKKHICDSLK